MKSSRRAAITHDERGSRKPSRDPPSSRGSWGFRSGSSCASGKHLGPGGVLLPPVQLAGSQKIAAKTTTTTKTKARSRFATSRVGPSGRRLVAISAGGFIYSAPRAAVSMNGRPASDLWRANNGARVAKSSCLAESSRKMCQTWPPDPAKT